MTIEPAPILVKTTVECHGEPVATVQINLWPHPDKPLTKQVRRAIEAAAVAAQEQATEADLSQLDKREEAG